jgi:hypothetical protein
MATKELLDVTVLVAETHKGKLAAVASNLKKKGFVLKESLGGIGILVGSVPAAALAELSDVPGVAAVENNGPITAHSTNRRQGPATPDPVLRTPDGLNGKDSTPR